MRPLRLTIELGEGVKAEMLFTPHLYSFKGFQNIDFVTDMENPNSVFETYADVMCCAALNAWVLDGHGDESNFPHKRGDFHAFMASEPKEFGKAVNFAVMALTGKTIEQFAADAKAQKPKESKKESKKKVSRLIGKILNRS